MWRIWWATTNAGEWQMVFNSAFKGLKFKRFPELYIIKHFADVAFVSFKVPKC